MTATDVVKRNGRREGEAYNRQKLHSSITAACLSVRTPEGHAESIAGIACDGIERWLEDKFEVTSTDIRRKAAELLEPYHPEAAYLYKNHSSIM